MRSVIPAACLVLICLCVTNTVFAEEVTVLFDGSDAAAWDTARDRDRLNREFSLSELSQIEGPALRWRFISRGISFNDIFLRRPVLRGFHKIRVQVRNAGANVTLAAKVGDADGAEWTANQVAVKAGADQQWIEFPWDEWKVASWSRDADGRMDFPLRFFTLIAFGVRPDAEYNVEVFRVEAVSPDPPVATLRSLDFPRTVRAGQKYAASLSFSLDRPCRDDQARLILRHGKSTVASVPLPLPEPLNAAEPDKVYSLSDIPVQVPQFAWGGQSSLQVRLGEAHIELNGIRVDEEVFPVTVEARTPGHVDAAVRMHNGAPTLFINGKPHNGMAYTAYGPSVEVFTDFARAGVNLFSFSATPTEAGYGLSRTAWTAPGEYDFSQLDERVMMVLTANPDAYIFPRLYLHAPEWWSKQHPDEIVLMDPGDGNPVPFIHSGGKPAPCWASEIWRKDTIEGLRRLIAHVESSPYADRVIGYHLASGTTEEWMMWGGNENEWVDYSPANHRAFRKWLAAKYDAIEALRAAWGDPEVTFDNATVPTKARRQTSRMGALRDPAQEQQIIDFYLYNSDMVAETIAVLSGAVKEITRREKAVGVFYGYTLQLCGEQRQQNAGHLALAKVLACPDVDFVCSPTSYAFRQLGGEGTSHFMSLLGSVKLHEKLWFDENDIRTSLSPGEVGSWGRPANVDGDIIQQDKELANVLTNGAAQWWFDVGANRYDDDRLMARIGELTRNAEQVLDLDRRPVDEVAMVVDERSLCYLQVAHWLGNELLVGYLPRLHRIGAPVGHYLASDLPRIADHKLFLIMTSFAPTEDDRKAVDALKRDGNVLVFFYAPGLYRDGKVDPAAMEDFTGIRLGLSMQEQALRVTFAGDHPLVEGLAGTQYGSGRNVSPICSANDPAATVLGTLPDGSAGLVVKEFEDWTAVHSAAALLPPEVVRALARKAGVHLYIETPDVVWAARDMVSVSVKDPGTRTIRLPEPRDVRDLYTGQEVAPRTGEFSADFADRATRVFVLE